jgi:hypothetical protein
MDRYGGEPKLEEILSDPIIHLVMKADRIDRQRLCKILVRAGDKTRPAPGMRVAQGAPS